MVASVRLPDITAAQLSHEALERVQLRTVLDTLRIIIQLDWEKMDGVIVTEPIGFSELLSGNGQTGS
jgi:hypothetical protein